MGSIFKFKSFEVDQEDCAMKINTDGVLLGAIVETDSPKRILDVGTGTGVIALMLAQRFSDAKVDAVEIDELASKRAAYNFNNSLFSDRLNVFHSSFDEIKSANRYDLIVSNPPFYTNSLHNPDDRKKLARHTDIDFFKNLIDFSIDNLAIHGQLTLIVPVDLSNEIIALTNNSDLNLVSHIDIRSFSDTEIIRRIISFRKLSTGNTNLRKDEFIIYEEKGVYSSQYKSILKPFFLAF